MVFFFQKKKQKAWFCCAEKCGNPAKRASGTRDVSFTRRLVFFFFQKKKQKALFRFAEEVGYPKLGEADVPPKAGLLVFKY
jgi:hypothetical protein